MRALVISGGGSKGAFAGGVAQYLIEEKKHEYDIFLGTSTGSLLITHLALKNIQKVKYNFTHVTQKMESERTLIYAYHFKCSVNST